MKTILIPVSIALLSCAPNPGPIKRQMVGLLEKFDRWDYNGNGHLEKSELKESALLSQFTEAEIIDFYDTGKDGRISFAEAKAGMSRVGEAREVAAQLEKGQ